jgi:hypothetical protein
LNSPGNHTYLCTCSLDVCHPFTGCGICKSRCVIYSKPLKGYTFISSKPPENGWWGYVAVVAWSAHETDQQHRCNHLQPCFTVHILPLRPQHNREFAMQPFEPSDGCLALRRLMANGSNGFDTCPYFWSH